MTASGERCGVVNSASVASCGVTASTSCGISSDVVDPASVAFCVACGSRLKYCGVFAPTNDVACGSSLIYCGVSVPKNDVVPFVVFGGSPGVVLTKGALSKLFLSFLFESNLKRAGLIYTGFKGAI